MDRRRSVPVGEFAKRATEFVRLVERTKEPLTITRWGRPVVELRPAVADADALRGSVKLHGAADLKRPSRDAEAWEANR